MSDQSATVLSMLISYRSDRQEPSSETDDDDDDDRKKDPDYVDEIEVKAEALAKGGSAQKSVTDVSSSHQSASR